MNGSYRPLRAPKTHYAAEVDYRRATTRAACGRTVDTGYVRSEPYRVDCASCKRASTHSSAPP